MSVFSYQLLLLLNIKDNTLSINLKICTLLKCITGGNGYINDYPTGRILRDAKLWEIGAGTSEIRRLVIGRGINSVYK